jgi:GAG-pre-integrase domain/Zinc knuckle
MSFLSSPPPTFPLPVPPPPQTPSVASSSASPSPLLQYIRPKIGNIDQTGPWTGGKPANEQWSDSSNSRPVSVYCYRSGKDFRQYQARTHGLTLKLKKDATDGHTLHSFASDVQRHLELHGMDAVFYVQDSTKQLCNIVQQHPLFTVENVADLVTTYRTTLYDDYDLDNLIDSREFLLNSIDSDIKLLISPFITSATSGPEIWMWIVGEIQSSSIERLVSVAENIKKCKLKSFKGENVKQYSAHMLTLCRDLANGQSLPRDICLTIVDQLIDCSVEKFRTTFLNLRDRIIDEMREYHGKSDFAIREMQVRQRLFTYESLLSKANTSYQTLLDLKQWGPNVFSKDKSGAPETLLSSAEVNALVQKAVAKVKKEFDSKFFPRKDKDVTCFNCGKKGHRKSDCKLPPKTASPTKSIWKTLPPKHGEPESKPVDGKEYHWCSKCKRWSPTHGTKDHKDLKKKDNTAEANVQEDGLYCQWTAETWSAEMDLLPQESIFIKYYIAMMFWIFNCVTWIGKVFHWCCKEILFSLKCITTKCPKSIFHTYRHHVRKHSRPKMNMEVYPASWCVFSCLQISQYTFHWLYGFIPKQFNGFFDCLKDANLNLNFKCTSCYLSSGTLDTERPNENESKFYHTITSMFCTTKQIEILWDTGATLSVTPHKIDFVTEIKECDTPRVMKGLAKGLNIAGTGEVAYTVRAQDGTDLVIRTPAYYVPQATRRILSPQAFFQYYGKKGSSEQNYKGIVLKVHDKEFHIGYNQVNNLPTFYAITNASLSSYSQPTTFVCLIDESNQNLSNSQKELLRWHFRLGHLNFASVQSVLRSGVVGYNPITKSASKCEHPKCASCRFGKARKNPTGSTHTTLTNHASLKEGDLKPGQRVSMDHFSVTEKGRLFDSKGKTNSDLLYTGGCLFCDHATGYIFINFHVHQNVQETLEAKYRFEKHLFDYGLFVQSYHTDNGIFSAKLFINEIENHLQKIRFSGPGAHHQNGIAERSIGTIFSIARTMMIHAAIRWKDVIEPLLWPMSIEYAVWIYNRMPKPNGLSPLEILSRIKSPRGTLSNSHVFGCPVYVLDPKLQGSSTLPKFTP